MKLNRLTCPVMWSPTETRLEYLKWYNSILFQHLRNSGVLPAETYRTLQHDIAIQIMNLHETSEDLQTIEME